MKKFFVLTIIILAFGFVTVSAQNISGWPPSAMLTKYGLDGMTMPNEMADPIWNEERGVPCVHIRFDGTNNTLTAIKDWLTGNGYVLDSDETSGSDIKLRYNYSETDARGRTWLIFKIEVVFDGRMGYIRAIEN